MNEQYLRRDQLLIAKIETTPGTEEVPSPAADAIRVANLRFTPGFEVDPANDEHTGSLDGAPPLVLGGGVQMAFDVRLKSSGAAGTRPQWGTLLQACGRSESILAVEETGTAQAGTTNTITLAAGANGTDDFYKGMPIGLTAGPGSGDQRVGIAYNGTTKVLTVNKAFSATPTVATDYRFPPNVLYKPVSADLDAATLYGYQNSNETGVNSRLRKAIGAMGNMTLELGPRTVPRASFIMSGILPALPTDVARPTGTVFDLVEAQAYRGALTTLGAEDLKFNTASLDLGNTVAQSDDPAQTFGMDRASITARSTTGRIVPFQRLLSSQDFMADFVNQVERAIVFSWGLAEGERLTLTIPRARYNGNPEEQDVNGFAADGVPYEAVGADDGLYICAH